MGSNDQILVADSSASTGLAWKSYGSQFVAGKNKIINGDFGVWQRGTSFSVNNASVYTSDRWYIGGSNTLTISQQAFTPGTAPGGGYEAQYFARVNRTARPTIYDDYFLQRIEDVRTFAGQTVTLSFWAKTNSGTTTLSGAYIEQWFGSGGSSSVYVNTSGALTLTTSWQRFTTTMTMPSIAGKTIGASSFVAVNFAMANSVGTSAVYDIWGVQLEAGSVATPFTTATGTIQGELAACQRYYYRVTATQLYSDFASGYNPSSSEGSYLVPFPVEMRTTPTALEQTGAPSNYNVLHSSGGTAARATCNSVPTFQQASKMAARVYFLVPGGSLTAGQGSVGGSSNNTVAYLGWSAEL